MCDLLEKLEKFLETGSTYRECRQDINMPDPAIYKEKFGSWVKAKNLALKNKHLNSLKLLSEELGRVPTLVDNNQCEYTASNYYYIKMFGSWNSTIKELGLEPNHNTTRHTDEVLLKHLDSFPETPKHKELDINRNTYCRRFGSWEKALDKVKKQKIQYKIPKEILIKEIQDFYKYNGRAPVYTEMKHDFNTYALNFGSFLKAIEAAEIPLNERNISIPELEIRELFPKDATFNDRSILEGKELDIVYKNLAIEYNGLFWHSEARVGKYYHLEKTEKAFQKGYKLIHIFENEWLYKRSIVESRINNLLNRSTKLYARKCNILTDIPKDFLELNHIQGNAAASVRLGLEYNNEVVAVMTFSKSRFSKKYEWELVRFCNKLNIIVVGGASKLLKYFERTYNPKSIVTYADRRWSGGELYETLGFEFSHASEPNYWYFKKNPILESRIKYQKHKLKDILEDFDSTLTEVENMYNNGYNRIFDCGNLVFTKFFSI